MNIRILTAICALILGVVFTVQQFATAQMKSSSLSVSPPPAMTTAGTQDQAGRKALDEYLDGIAAKDEAQRATAVAAIRTRAEAEASQQEVRGKLLELIGGLPERTPLDPKVLGETKADRFAIHKVLFYSQPNFPVTALLYVPDGATAGKRAAILMSPGHGPAGKAGDAGMAALFALNGFVVLSYDPIGQGERLQYPDPLKPGTSLASRPTGEHGEASLQPMLIGDSFARYEVWDAMRGIDYLSALPYVDAKRIGAFGCSGGGTITALVGALDTRVAAVGTACYTTSFGALLSSIGPQDAEQSTPRFISSGLGFPDWSELAAPRPYAVIATYSDMFPFAGARATVTEARRFYSLFDPASAGMPVNGEAAGVPPTPDGPAMNADTTNHVPLTARFQFITGPGHHGALRPIMGNILGFFMRNLEPGSDADHPVIPPAYLQFGPQNPMAKLGKNALQVTLTGQVATSYPGCATVHSLNLERVERMIPAKRPFVPEDPLATAIRQVTGADAVPGASKFAADALATKSGSSVLTLDGFGLVGVLAVPRARGRHAAVILLAPDSIEGDSAIDRENKAEFERLAAAGNVVLAFTPRPSPPGWDEMKSPILGPDYLLSLRAELVGKTLVGLRVDDVIRATDYLAQRSDVDAARISAMGSGHMGLVLMHAAVLDRRLKHITVNHVLESYKSLIEAPLPVGAPEDVIPGVLRLYDIPDLAHALGTRLTERNALTGTADLSQTSTPLSTLEK
ncbi:MAG TPA: acetylxylan esterase [Terracidiphilus sp.]|nr:acetylxylan esterase [Terracidiphilus sp.]